MSDTLTDIKDTCKQRLADKICAACGGNFRPRRASSRFCSVPCARTINGGHNYKGESWWLSKKGYIAGRIRVNGKQRSVRKHRLVMEQFLGHEIPANFDVHHKDGNKTNNDISNLELLEHGGAYIRA